MNVKVEVGEGRMKGNKEDVADDGALGKSAQGQWNHDQAAGDDDVKEM